MTSTERKDRLPLWAYLAVCLALSSLYLWNGFRLPKSEGLDYSIYPLIIFARDALRGSFPHWSFLHGIGGPWPIPHILGYSPVTPLFAVVAPYTAVALTIFAHLALSGYCLDLILRRLGASSIARATALAGYAFLPAIEYQFAADALEVFVTYLMYPVMLLFLLRLLFEPEGRRWGDSLGLASSAAYAFWNGHPGTLSVSFISIGLVGLLAPDKLLRRWREVLLAAGLGTLLVCGKLYYLVSELRRFDPNVPRLQDPLIGDWLRVLWSSSFRPFPLPRAGSDYWSLFVTENLVNRNIGFGLIGLVLAIGYLAHARKASEPATLGRALVVSFLLFFIPVERAPSAVSATWLFRDPINVYGILLSSLGLTALQRRVGVRKVGLLAGFQIALLLAGAIPLVFGGYLDLGDKSGVFTVGEYNHTVAQPPRDWIERLRSRPGTHPTRVMTTGYVSYLLDKEGLVDLGAVNNVLPVFGIAQVSAISKGISYDAIGPSPSIPYGAITSSRFTWSYNAQRREWPLTDALLREVLGIDWIIAEADKTLALPSEWREVPRLEGRHGKVARIFERETPALRAWVIPRDLLNQDFPLKPDCPHRSLVCVQLDGIQSYLYDPRSAGAPGRSEVQLDGEVIRIRVDSPLAETSDLLVSSMFREQWQIAATSEVSGKLVNWNGLLRVSELSGRGWLELKFRDSTRQALNLLSLLSAVACLLVVTWKVIPRRRTVSVG